MRFTTLRSGLLGGGLLAASLLSTTAPAPAADQAVVIYSAGVDDMLVDEKDRVLRRALGMIGDRVMELPEEVGERDMPAPLIRMGLEMLMSPMTFQLSMLEDAEQHEGPPIAMQLSIGARSAGEATRRTRMMMRLTDQVPWMPALEEDPDQPGMQMAADNGTTLRLGQMEFDGRPSFVAALNTLETESPQLDRLGLPADVEPAFAIKVDMEKLQPLMEMMLAQAPRGQAEMVRGQLAMAGMTGEHPATFQFICGHGPDRSHGVMRYSNYGKLGIYTTGLVREPLDRDAIELIPDDATYAEVWRYDLAAIPDLIRGMMGQMAEGMAAAGAPPMHDPLALLEGMTGIDLEGDVLDHLGTTMGYYTSQTTGGGGLMSMVGFADIRDEQALRDGLDRVAASINELGDVHARGYVRMKDRQIAGHDVTSLMFPGLPIPLEISWTIHDGRLWKGATPQALIEAVRHAESGGSSLTDNPRFRELAKTMNMREAMGFSFTDTPELLDDGYGITNMAMTALANALRSPLDLDRETGLIMPPYGQLRQNAKASLIVSHMDGDDLVARIQGDRSMLVNLTGVAGSIGGTAGPVAVAALGTGIMLPAFSKARENAQLMKSKAQLKEVSMAVQIYAVDNRDQLPDDVDSLLEQNLIPPDILSSPVGSVYDGGGDYWFNLDHVDRMSEVKDPSRTILGYDRASYIHRDDVNVVFFDGHVETMPHWKFDDLIMQPQHEGIDFNVPDRW